MKLSKIRLKNKIGTTEAKNKRFLHKFVAKKATTEWTVGKLLTLILLVILLALVIWGFSTGAMQPLVAKFQALFDSISILFGKSPSGTASPTNIEVKVDKVPELDIGGTFTVTSRDSFQECGIHMNDGTIYKLNKRTHWLDKWGEVYNVVRTELKGATSIHVTYYNRLWVASNVWVQSTDVNMEKWVIAPNEGINSFKGNTVKYTYPPQGDALTTVTKTENWVGINDEVYSADKDTVRKVREALVNKQLVAKLTDKSISPDVLDLEENYATLTDGNPYRLGFDVHIANLNNTNSYPVLYLTFDDVMYGITAQGKFYSWVDKSGWTEVTDESAYAYDGSIQEMKKNLAIYNFLKAECAKYI